MWQNLKNKIKAIVAANTLVTEVYDYEEETFGGDPVVTITPSSSESDYRSTKENRRIYAFNLTVWVKRSAPRTAQTAENVLTEVVDSICDDFDKYFTLGVGSPGAALSLPTGYTMIMVQATPSAWMYSERETWYRGAEIKIKCEVDVDVFSIS
jgi:hypothetical protein